MSANTNISNDSTFIAMQKLFVDIEKDLKKFFRTIYFNNSTATDLKDNPDSKNQLEAELTSKKSKTGSEIEVEEANRMKDAFQIFLKKYDFIFTTDDIQEALRLGNNISNPRVPLGLLEQRMLDYHTPRFSPEALKVIRFQYILIPVLQSKIFSIKAIKLMSNELLLLQHGLKNFAEP